MKSKRPAPFHGDPGLVRSGADDNLSSESQLRTLRYRPGFPGRFGSIERSRVFCRPFLRWYSRDRRRAALALLAPAAVHYGQAPGSRPGRAPSYTRP